MIALALACFGPVTAAAQSGRQPDATDRYSVATNSFWSNWYVQAGMDMALQNPCNYDFSKVFPNGKTFGIDVAVGKWFTPGIGVRFKANWNNCIGGVFENRHLSWVGPMGTNGINHDEGGFGAVFGDVQFNIFHFIYGHNENRKWSLLVYPRMGAISNFAVHSGSPVIGAGVQNLYRINGRWSVYFDAAYHMMSSGFNMDDTVNTGTGSNSNGYFDLSVGVQLDLGINTFKKL